MMSATHASTILIADDHPIFRKGLVETVKGDAQFIVAGEAGDGGAAWEMIQSLRPDIAVLDIDMPVLDGLRVTAKTREAELRTSVIILTIHKEENIFNAALDAGARGYLLKEDAAQDLVRAIRTVIAGEVFLSSSISSFLLNRARRMESLRSGNLGISHLTPMELRVLKLVGENCTNNQIGQKLFISPRTVHTHRNNICAKLGLHGARGLLLFALEHREDLQRIQLLPLRAS